MARQTGWLRVGVPVLFGVSLLSAGLADFLFYDEIVGWTLGGFTAWLLVLLLSRYRRSVLTGPRRAWGWALTLMTLGLCVSLVLEPGVLAGVLSMIALGSLALLAHDWSDRRLGWAWLGRLVSVWVIAPVRPVLDSRLAQRWARRTRGLRNRVKHAGQVAWAFAGVAVPVLLSLLFLGLFSLANPVVDKWMGSAFDEVGDVFLNLGEHVTVWRVLLWYAAAFACWGLLRHRPRREPKTRRLGPEMVFPHPVEAAAQRKRNDQPMTQDNDAPAEPAPPADTDQADRIALLVRRFQGLIIRCLVAMNAVFAVQLVLDSRYLVLGDTLPAGMSYAEYAHRGAYPLIATAILAAAMVLAVFRPGGVAQRSRLARWLVLLWIAQNILLVVSAAWRLGAYVEVYTLTRLRVAAAVWMLMVAGCLLLLIWRIARHRDNAWLTGWAMGWGLCVLWVCSFVPFDPMIARYNVNNCRELGGSAGPIDVAYLEVLGVDALPALDHLIASLPAEYADAPSAYSPEPGAGREWASIERVKYDTWDAPPGPDATLGVHLALLRVVLVSELDEQLEGWRGWTARRAWLRGATAE